MLKLNVGAINSQLFTEITDYAYTLKCAWAILIGTPFKKQTKKTIQNLLPPSINVFVLVNVNYTPFTIHSDGDGLEFRPRYTQQK